MFNDNETKILVVIITRIVRKWHSTFGTILGFIIGFLQLQVNRFKRYCILQEFLYIIIYY
jgi:hypothetical protein